MESDGGGESEKGATGGKGIEWKSVGVLGAYPDPAARLGRHAELDEGNRIMGNLAGLYPFCRAFRSEWKSLGAEGLRTEG